LRKKLITVWGCVVNVQTVRQTDRQTYTYNEIEKEER